jgi:hypothetical protein
MHADNGQYRLHKSYEITVAIRLTESLRQHWILVAGKKRGQKKKHTHARTHTHTHTPVYSISPESARCRAMPDTYLRSTSQRHFVCGAIQEAGRYKSYRISLQCPNDPPGHVFFLAEDLQTEHSDCTMHTQVCELRSKRENMKTTALQMNTQKMQITEKYKM